MRKCHPDNGLGWVARYMVTSVDTSNGERHQVYAETIPITGIFNRPVALTRELSVGNSRGTFLGGRGEGCVAATHTYVLVIR